jgi:hypothetical protein
MRAMKNPTHRLALVVLAASSLLIVACDSGGGGTSPSPDEGLDPEGAPEVVGGIDEGQDVVGGIEEGQDVIGSPVGDVVETPVAVCEADLSTGCLCDNGYLGNKTCASDGLGFSACVCETCAASCEGMSCGDDGCGGSCGICFGSDVCKAGVCKVDVQCPAGGTGMLVGDQIKNVIFDVQSGQKFGLHELCGEPKAVWITLVAGWCTACAELAPTFQAMHEQLKSEDVAWMLVVGDDGSYNPASWSYAKQYHDGMGYPETWPWYADGSFMGIGTAAQIADAQGTFFLPFHIILGSDMSIQFMSDETSTEVDAMMVLQSLL